MDEPGGRCAQRNEPATQGQILQGATQTSPGRVSSTERDRGVTVGTRGGKRGMDSPCSMGTEFQYGMGTEIRRWTWTVCWSHTTECPALPRNRTWRSYSPSAGVGTAHRQRAGPRNKAEWTEADPAAVRIKVVFPSTGEETHTVLQTTWDVPVVAGKARL